MIAAWRQTAPLGALAAALLLGGCQSSGGTLGGGSPAGIPIAIESVEGPPAPLQSALAGELVAAASTRRVDLAGGDVAARYRVRGYLSPETTSEGGAAMAYVWEVYDSEKRRATRLTGSSPLRSAGDDPWSGLDKAALARLAAQSMDEIAVFLTDAKAAGGAVTARAETGAGLGYAAE